MTFYSLDTEDVPDPNDFDIEQGFNDPVQAYMATEHDGVPVTMKSTHQRRPVFQEYDEYTRAWDELRLSSFEQLVFEAAMGAMYLAGYLADGHITTSWDEPKNPLLATA